MSKNASSNRGPVGPTGPAGSGAGVTGPTGLTGPTGPGMTGPTGPAGSGSSSSSIQVAQDNSFIDGQAVYFTGTSWQLAQANSSTTLGLGIVTNVVTGVAPTAGFTVNFSGPITVPGPLTPGEYYFVSTTTPGALTSVAPTSSADFSNPLLFAISSTSAIVLPYRPSSLNANSNAGSAPAIDANHLYVWACDDNTGASSFTNTGASAGGSATFSGSVELQYKRIGRSAISTMLYADAANSGAFADSISIPVTNGFTLEAFVNPDQGPFAGNVSVAVGTNFGTVDPNVDYAHLFIAGDTWRLALRRQPNAETVITGPKVNYGAPVYIVGTCSAPSGTSTTMKLYMNGRIWASATGQIPANAFNSLAVGNLHYSRLYAFAGAIMQVRASNIERSAAYVKDTAKTLFAM